MIRWGVIGLGNMATKFCEAIKEVDNAELKGISSKSKLSLTKFGKSFNIDEKYQFKNYQELIDCSDVDAVYISTLNNTHFDLIKASIQNNKKILCEKPFVLNLTEANEIKKLIDNKKIFFFEAIAYRSHPQTKEILKLIQDDVIGSIKKIEASFGFKVRKVKKDSRLFNKDFGGGAILDLGCYPISFMQLFDADKNKYDIIDQKNSLAVTGVDDHAEMKCLINKKIEVILKVSLKENLSNNCIVYGSKGNLIIPQPWLPQQKTYLEIYENDRYFKKFIQSEKSIYAYQIEVVSNIFLDKNPQIEKNLINIDKSLVIMDFLEKWKKN